MPHEDDLRSAIQKAGPLPEPMTVYLGIGPDVYHGWKNRLDEARQHNQGFSFAGVHTFTRDPDIALPEGTYLLLELTARTGLALPNDKLELAQVDTMYEVVDYVCSERMAGQQVEIYYLDEMV